MALTRSQNRTPVVKRTAQPKQTPAVRPNSKYVKITEIRKAHKVEIRALRERIQYLEQTSLRQKDEKERLDRRVDLLEKEFDKKELELVTANNKLNDFSKAEDGCEARKMITDLQTALESQRRRALEYQVAAIKGQEDMEGCAKVWKFCEICAVEYGQTGDITPRVLDCGHTLCEGCIKKIITPYDRELRCPFDRQLTVTRQMKIEELPKNFLVLGM